MPITLQKEEEAKEQAKKEREKKEQSLKDRLQKDVDEAEKRRKKAAHADAVANYLTLLNETVKDPEARWSEWKTKLQQDPQVRISPVSLLKVAPPLLRRSKRTLLGRCVSLPVQRDASGTSIHVLACALLSLILPEKIIRSDYWHSSIDIIHFKANTC